MRLDPQECPCGCGKVILFGCQCSSLPKVEAAEVYEAVTHYGAVKDALTSLLAMLPPGFDKATFKAKRTLAATTAPMPVKPVPDWMRAASAR